uniref:Reverse transcriptase domain-containing protein n=1 Tax=Solanum lycopersicum TaxID=4081 RepID=A0A3Q7EF73_SOLLC
MRMCVDYRALNKATVNNKYPVPLVQYLMDMLSKVCWFTKLDLRACYCQVRIAKGDEPKTTYVTTYGSYEFVVMPFGLTNASTTFCNLLNNVLFDYLDDFVVVYLDDIATIDWKAPRNVKDLRSFLGLANYYRKFIAGYSKRVVTLTDLLKKDAKWIWVIRYEEDFQNLKEAIASERILKLIDFDLPFEVHTDASDKAIGGVLVQEGPTELFLIVHRC